MVYDPKKILLAVQSLRPGLEVVTDFELAIIDGKHQISVWHRTDVVQPSQAEIEAVNTDNLPPLTPEETRDSSFLSDVDRQAVMDKLVNATPAQIKAYVLANVTDLPSARLMLTRIFLVLATIARQ